MNEHSFIKSVHRYLSPDVFKWKIHDTYTGGVPDSFYAGPAGILFVEYKYIKKLPARNDTLLRTSLSPLQIQWLNKMVDFNQRAAVVIGCEESAIILLEKQWTTNISKSYYMEHAVPRKDIASWIQTTCLQEVRNEQGRESPNGR